MAARATNGQVKILENKNETPRLRSKPAERKLNKRTWTGERESRAAEWRPCTRTPWPVNPSLFPVTRRSYLTILLILVRMGSYYFIVKVSIIVIQH